MVLLIAILDTLFASLSGQIFQTDFVISVATQATQPMNIPGSITMQDDKFVLSLFDMEAAYDGQTLYMYQDDAKELTLSQPTEEELLSVNPMAFAKALQKESNITERESKDGQTVYVTLTPKNQAAGIQRFVVKLRKRDAMPLSVEMVESKQTTTLVLKNPQYISQAPEWTISKPDAFINDIR